MFSSETDCDAKTYSSPVPSRLFQLVRTTCSIQGTKEVHFRVWGCDSAHRVPKRTRETGSSGVEKSVFQSPVCVSSAWIGSPKMICIRTARLCPRSHLFRALFRPHNGVSISYPITEPIYTCSLSPSGLYCESNHCSLCLCVRLCWGKGALWGTLDSQVTWLCFYYVWPLLFPFNFC